MGSTLEWYLRMQRKWRARDRSRALGLNYTSVFTRAGGLYCFEGEDFVMVFDVTRYIKQNGRLVADGLTHMGTLRGKGAASLLAEMRKDVAEEQLDNNVAMS